MILYIDRGITERGLYRFDFGIDFDILIASYAIQMNTVREDMATIDKIVTNSPSLVFCVTHIKHPMLLEKGSDSFPNGILKDFNRKKLRNYFALRLIHRRHEVKLYENGKRLFNH
ncbi:MAG: hypothetical protein ACOC2U_02820 [bacterium]